MANTVKQIDKTHAKDGTEIPSTPESVKHIPKTRGEKWFNAIRFGVAESVILGLTAVIAFESSKHAKDFYGPVPNYLKRAEQKFEAWVTRMLPKTENGVVVAGAVASTMVTFHGGNLFAPVMKGLQDNQTDIVDSINKKHGKPGELEAGRERLKHHTKESWGDVLKGRLASWLMVFASFVGADLVAGKNAQGVRHFDAFQNKFATKFSGIVSPGKPVNVNSKTFQYGRIFALDLFATTAAVVLWTTISKFSAIVRGRKAREAQREREGFAEGERAVEASLQNKSEAPALEQGEKQKSFSANLGNRPQDFRALSQQQTQGSQLMGPG